MAEIANMPLNLHFQQFMKSYLSEDLYNNYQIPTRTGLDLRGKMPYINAKTIWLLEMFAHRYLCTLKMQVNNDCI